MKSNFLLILTQFIIFNFIFSTNLIAQKNNNNNNNALIAAVGLVGAVAATSVLIEEYKEILETEALDYILSNHPELTEFRIKLFFEEGQKVTDQSQSSAFVFFLTTMNNGRKIKERKILLRFTNDQFINEFGNEVIKVNYVLLDSNEWNSIMAFYGNLMGSIDSIVRTDKDYDFITPLYSKAKCKDDLAIQVNHYNIFGYETTKCFKPRNTTYELKNLFFTTKGFVEYADYRPGIFPFFKLKGDDYIIGDYSNSYKIFGNEKTIGFYLKSMSRSILLKPIFISEIHSFINFHDELFSGYLINPQSN